MRKLEKKTLDELSNFMPVINEMEQTYFIGGSGASDVYDYDVMVAMLRDGTWKGGYVHGKNDYVPSFIGSGMFNSYYIGPTPNIILMGLRPKPVNAADYIAQQHDFDYYNLNLNGISGTMSEESEEADKKLIERCRKIISLYEDKEYKYDGYTINGDAVSGAQKMISYFNSIGGWDIF